MKNGHKKKLMNLVAILLYVIIRMIGRNTWNYIKIILIVGLSIFPLSDKQYFIINILRRILSILIAGNKMKIITIIKNIVLI